MKAYRSFIIALMAIGLVGCGGGGGNSLTGGGAGSGAATVATITVTASASSVASDGSTASTVTATAVNASNVAVSGVSVSFSASAGGTLTVTQGTTDTNGVATASLKSSTATAGSAITVTATAGSVSGKVAVNVVDAQHVLSLKVDGPQIPSDGSRVATVTAFLKDANNNALPNVAITFRSSSGVVVVTKGTTDSNGLATATVSAGSDPQNRRITVTGSAPSSADATVGVDVIGSSLSITGPETLVLGNDGSLTVALKDSSGHGIPGQSVTVSSGNGNAVFPATVTTDLNGLGSIVLHANNVGIDSITASALGLTANRAVTVSSQSFNMTDPSNGSFVALNTSQAVTANWLSAGAPVVGQTVTFTTTRGTFDRTSTVTDSSGAATVHLSSTNAGPAIISASGSGVAAQTVVDFVATTPSQTSASRVCSHQDPSVRTVRQRSVRTRIDDRWGRPRWRSFPWTGRLSRMRACPRQPVPTLLPPSRCPFRALSYFSLAQWVLGKRPSVVPWRGSDDSDSSTPMLKSSGAPASTFRSFLNGRERLGFASAKRRLWMT